MSDNVDTQDISDEPHDHVVVQLTLEAAVPRKLNEVEIILYAANYVDYLFNDPDVTDEEREALGMKLVSRTPCEDIPDPDEPFTIDNVIQLKKK